jgi:methylthioribose-1-phosphate isomerase
MSDSWFTLRWTPAGVVMLDQRALPGEERYLTLETLEEVAGAIEQMVIRGAPAIACAAALGVALVASRSRATRVSELVDEVDVALERLARTRPTAVNLFWALDRMRDRMRALHDCGDVEQLRAGLIAEAERLLEADLKTNRAIGANGLSLVPDGARVLTHCNAGALATSGYGTALGVVRAAAESGRTISVVADETRPFLQGSRLTAWELARDGIPVSVITDGMAGHLMSQGEVDLVIVGADRIAANGDVANKIGTYPLAVLAREHGLPFHVAAPLSTVDLATPDGASIPIEQRSSREVEELAGIRLVPDGVTARHPAFDVTPARLVTGIITEAGIARAPYAETLKAWVNRAASR